MWTSHDSSSIASVSSWQLSGPHSQVHSRQEECSSQQAKSLESGPKDRVVSASGDSSQAFASVGETSDSLLCNKVQQEARGLLFSGPRFLRRGRRCPSTFLGQSGSLLIPLLLPDPSCPEQIDDFSDSQDDLRCSFVASSKMVPGSAISAFSGSERNLLMAQPPLSTSCREISSIGRVPISSQLETIQYLLRARGFSCRAVKEMSG